MRILLLGEFSGLHHHLAEGLRALGQMVTVASDGCGWQQIPRDTDLSRRDDSLLQGVSYLARILRLLPRWRGYDVVQLIHPSFLRLKAEHSLFIFDYLRKHNTQVFLGAFGADYYYAKACTETNLFRYSDFVTPYYNEPLPNAYVLGKAFSHANRHIASRVDGIVACLWEYYAAYHHYLPEKTCFIPLPIRTDAHPARVREKPEKLSVLIGIQSRKTKEKGTDKMLKAWSSLQEKYSDRVSLRVVQDVPQKEYLKLFDHCDVLVDQLYSYTPGMNALLAMSQGIVVVSGGEPENYEILGELNLRPIINVSPDEKRMKEQFEWVITHPEFIPSLSAQSIAYVHKHHDHLQIAHKYLTYWRSPSR